MIAFSFVRLYGIGQYLSFGVPRVWSRFCGTLFDRPAIRCPYSLRTWSADDCTFSVTD
jgi:hypothetical protein